MGMHLNPLTWQLWGYVVLAWLMCMVVLSDLLEHRIHTSKRLATDSAAACAWCMISSSWISVSS